MQIIRAEEMGFCFGVRRAVEMMEASVRERGPMVSLGSVVHNPQVVRRLHDAGLEVISDVSNTGARPVAITAHGVSKQVIGDLEASGADIIDTTCPIVTRSQQWAHRLSEEGFAVVIFGDPNHKEVRGVLGWAHGHVLVVASEDDVKELPEGFPSRVGVLSQTTETEARFASFVKKMFEVNLDRISELRVLNTLCHATTAQQAATMHLAESVTMMIVVGGRESANTRHLAVVAGEHGVVTHHIETAEEIDAAWLKGHERVGVTAGASTPDFIIDEVVERLEALAPA
ncbi:MAG TPA: 4-hydroxy-3-methylbut-2-enyl diphosphate reductase [Dehalococcoidia bacterium]|nr:4-hydroxy-3-methylbut-2-enyl diphosphate reductase [Dehalococcoidia bacterium]